MTSSRLGITMKNTIKAIRHPTSIDLAWAAGFIDGEGNFSVTRQTKNGGGQRMMAAQKDPELLYRLQEIFGGSVNRYKVPNSYIHYWYVTGTRARGVMLTLYKFMSAKRRAEILKALGHATASAPEGKEQPRGTQD